MGKTSHHKHHTTTVKSNRPHATESQSVEFIQHVHEFRNRIFWVALLFIVTSALGYQFRDILVHLVLSPLGDQKLIYLTPAGGFSFIFQITLYAGAVLTAPFLVYQIYKFVTPALPLRARKHAAIIFIAALLLMCGGVAFGYFVAVPAALHFLTTFAGGYVDASLTADSYLNFILGYVVGLGILFQLPLLLIFWHWIKPLSPKQLLNSERFMLVFSMIAAAIITPTPDIVNQLLIAGPILLIYQIGVITILVMTHKDRKKAKRIAKRAARVEAREPLTQGDTHPLLALPSLEDLVPQQGVAQARSLRPATKAPTAPAHKVAPKPITQSSFQPKVVPKQSAAAPQTYRPTLNTLSVRPRTRSLDAAVRAHTAAPVRPLPVVSRQRPVSLDGFVMSS